MRARTYSTLLVCMVLAILTGIRLYKMAAVEGWLPGARPAVHAVVEKYQVKTRRRRLISKLLDPPYIYSVKLSNTTSGRPLELPKERWQLTKIGTPVQVLYVGTDQTPYVAGGTYSSDLNFIFYFIAFWGELFVGLLALVQLDALRRPSQQFGGVTPG